MKYILLNTTIVLIFSWLINKLLFKKSKLGKVAKTTFKKPINQKRVLEISTILILTSFQVGLWILEYRALYPTILICILMSILTLRAIKKYE